MILPYWVFQGNEGIKGRTKTNKKINKLSQPRFESSWKIKDASERMLQLSLFMQALSTHCPYVSIAQTDPLSMGSFPFKLCRIDLLSNEVICSYVYKIVDNLSASVERSKINRADFRKGMNNIHPKWFCMMFSALLQGVFLQALTSWDLLIFQLVSLQCGYKLCKVLITHFCNWSWWDK